LGSKLFWPVWFKRQGITFWLTFLDKFGSPTAVGEYPAGTTPNDQQTLLDALSAISQDAGVVVPQGMVIKLLEAQRGGQAGYEQMCRYMDEQIAYCILGEAPNVKGSGGQAASAAITRNEVRLELTQYDSDMLSATLNSTVVKWITEFNVPGAKPPTVWRKIVEAEDIKVRAERDQILYEMNLRPTAEYMAENYPGWEMSKVPANAGKAVAFAEIAASLTDQMDAESTAAWDAVTKHVGDLVSKADSLAALQQTLTDSYGGLPLDDLRKIMAQGFQLAALAGIADVKSGN